MKSSMEHSTPSRYGVIEQTSSASDVDNAVESLRHLGYAIVDGGWDQQSIDALADAFERSLSRGIEKHGGRDALVALDEINTIRLPMLYEPLFLRLASNNRILEICRNLIAGYVILNQQNGVINPPHSGQYNQGQWHRDLPYQHFVSSRPLAVNALFCLDAFTVANGATMVLPASHRQEAFPSDGFVSAQAISIEAPAGSFIVLDGMAFHSGGVNTTDKPRRAINHVYTIPHIRQQIDLPSALGDQFTSDAALRRLLGYGLSTPRSVEEYLAGRQKR
jgi:ectoine hydroxylase-related dioxygenase (phytanoyl-CoA dioxygenase family)